MTFSFFAILMILIVALVAFIHMLQGFFSATISAILAIFAAVFALSYHETIVEKYLGGAMADSAHGMVLIVLFATIYFGLRVLFDQAVPGNLRLPAAADKVGGAVMGAVAGIFAAGVIAIAAQEMSFFPAIMGYSRYAVDDHQVRLPTAGRTQDMTVKDQMNSPTFDDAESAGEQQKLLLPVDDIVVNMTSRLSSAGALSAGQPLSTIHPNWLQELFGQRLGMEPGAKRVLMATPSAKSPDAKVDNLYLVSETNPKTHLTDLPWIDGEYGEVRGSSKPKVAPVTVDGAPSMYYAVKPNHYLVVARIRFNLNAGDKLAGGVVRIGPGAVRLVAPGVSLSTNEPLDHVDYYPIGTLQYKGPNVMINSKAAPTTLIKPVLVLQNTDDFLFIKKDDSQPDSPNTSELDAGADFVFSVSSSVVDAKKMQMKDGAFIEVKRLVREDLSGHALLPEPMLRKDQSTIAVFRRDKLLHDALAQKNLYADPNAAPVETASTPTPPTPAPTPTPTPTPAPASAGPAFPLEVGDVKLSDQFYTNVAVDQDSGDRTMNYPNGAKGTISVDSNQIHALTIDGALPADIRSGPKSVKTLAAPLNMALVQVTGKPKADADTKPWSWKDGFNDLALVDGAGARIGPPIGAWVQYTDGGTKVSARFNAEGGAKVDDITAAGEVKQVWFVFAVPHGAKIAKVVAGQATVSEQPLEVP